MQNVNLKLSRASINVSFWHLVLFAFSVYFGYRPLVQPAMLSKFTQLEFGVVVLGHPHLCPFICWVVLVWRGYSGPLLYDRLGRKKVLLCAGVVFFPAGLPARFCSLRDPKLFWRSAFLPGVGLSVILAVGYVASSRTFLKSVMPLKTSWHSWPDISCLAPLIGPGMGIFN